MQNWSDKLTSDLIFKLKLPPTLFQNRAPRGPNGFQNSLGGLLRGQAGKKTFLKASRMPQGPLWGGHLGGQNPSKPVPEAFPTRTWYRRAFWNRFGTSWTPILECFFKSSWAKMIGKSDYSDETKIFKNTCVFPVRLHLRNVEKRGRKLGRAFFF